jgi:hypothetical protein
MTSRMVSTVDARLSTDDGDGVTREWDAVTYQHIRTLRQTIGDITFAAYCSCGASFIVYGDPSDDDRAASEDFTFEHESCVP